MDDYVSHSESIAFQTLSYQRLYASDDGNEKPSYSKSG